MAPSVTYSAHFPAYYEGNYREALAGFKDEIKGAIKTSQSRWIDSICYFTMAGECYYKMGQFGDALDNYTAALQLYLQFSNWMVQVQYQQPSAALARPAIPWGRSQRNAKLGRFPATMLMSQGQPVTEASIRKGGPISPPILVQVNVQEIARCTALAMKRRHELLGPVCKFEPLTDQLLVALTRPQTIPNHWSEAWVDVQVGIAAAAAGNTGEAIARLQRSLLVSGELDHPLTGLALMELGDVATRAGKLSDASRFYEEASYTAAEYGDMMVLEEAFRAGYNVHVASNRKQEMAALAPAIAWAGKKGTRELHTSLLLLAADSAAASGQTAAAVALLNQAKTQSAKREMSLQEIGARLNHLLAITLYQRAMTPAGDESIQLALKLFGPHSKWLYQIRLTSERLEKGRLSGRNAAAIYELLGSDPAPFDWSMRPLECLAVLTTPHPGMFDQWFAASRDPESAFEVADRARRHRFHSSLVLGGRLLAMRWILEAPEEQLGDAARLERRDLLAKYPKYADLATRSSKVKAQLGGLPLQPDRADADRFRKHGELQLELGKIAAEQEVVVREMAVRREPASFVFPPLEKTKEVQAALPAGQVLLNTYAMGGKIYCLLMSKGRYATWTVENASLLERKLAVLLRSIGNFDGNRELTLTQLSDPAWKAASRDLLDTFLAGSKVNLGQKFDELIVIPDGVLWYLPFEALQVGDAKQPVSLISKSRVRYAPTMSLALGKQAGRRPSPVVAAVATRSAAKDDNGLAQEAVEKLRESFPNTVLLQPSQVAPSPLLGAFIDIAVVFDDLPNRDAMPYDWPILPIDRGRGLGTLAAWLGLPWKRPDVFVLPGFHTAAENALKDGASQGNDVFLSVCGLMATGARTVLVSRWRTGGHSSFELSRQFVQEIPQLTATNAWQRSVQLLMESPVEWKNEPRIKLPPAAQPEMNADHPFFWAGYLLVDDGTAPLTAETPASKPADPAGAKPAAPIPAAAGQPAVPPDPKPGAGADEETIPPIDLNAQPVRALPSETRSKTKTEKKPDLNDSEDDAATESEGASNGDESGASPDQGS